MSDFDNLRRCKRCGDRDTTNANGICSACREQEMIDDCDFDDWESVDRTCPYCNGTGGDRWNDGITPCEHCDGEGYEYWT